MQDWVEHIGIIAATCTTLAFVPQAVHTIRSRQTGDISLSMYIIFNIGLTLWLIYGVMIDNLPIILANVCTLALTTIILGIKVKNTAKKSP